MDREVVVVGMARTPQGAFMGALASVPAPKLGAVAIKAALERAGLAPDSVDQVIMGNVLGAGQGQAPARQAMIHAGLPTSVPAMTINKVCGSGMAALRLAAQAIRLGDGDIVVAGGMENMSQAPYLLPKAREGMRLGHQQVIDSMVQDGLWDPYNDKHMGSCAEACASERNISRADQDAFAMESFRRAQAAQEAGWFEDEIAPVTIAGARGATTLVTEDEGPRKANFEKMPQLRPVFEKEGTITAANASTINDGAAALVLASAERARELKLTPLARLVSSATNSHDPLWFTTAPVGAIQKAASAAAWDLDAIDLFEINEAFALVTLAAQRELNLDAARINVHGGAIALGHPIGASGARIVVTLLSALKRRGGRRGLAALCIGGGEGIATCWELC